MNRTSQQSQIMLFSQPRHWLGSGQSHRQRKQQRGQMDQWGDTYQEGTRQVDEQRRGVLPTIPHIQHPVRPETELQTAIRQTVPTKASVEAETSTIISTRLFFNEFHFETSQTFKTAFCRTSLNHMLICLSLEKDAHSTYCLFSCFCFSVTFSSPVTCGRPSRPH